MVDEAQLKMDKEWAREFVEAVDALLERAIHKQDVWKQLAHSYNLIEGKQITAEAMRSVYRRAKARI